VEEEVVRFSLRDAAGDHRGARYALADANRAGLLEIESRPDESPDDRPAEPVAAVRLPSGLALAVGKRLLLYKGGAFLDAPESTHVERRAFEKRASDRARSVLTKLDAELPPGEPCSDVRLGFTIKLAAELRGRPACTRVVRDWPSRGARANEGLPRLVDALPGALSRSTSHEEGRDAKNRRPNRNARPVAGRGAGLKKVDDRNLGIHVRGQAGDVGRAADTLGAPCA
jgi:hypothetical protein